jgi:hypothetical protein
MTMMRRSENEPVPAVTWYLAVNVFDPAVNVTTDTFDSRKVALAAGVYVDIAHSFNALWVVAPEMANDMNGYSAAVLLFIAHEMKTRAEAPAVTVTAGPAVVRSV